MAAELSLHRSNHSRCIASRARSHGLTISRPGKQCQPPRGELFTGHKLALAELPTALKANVIAWGWRNPGFTLRYYANHEQEAYVTRHCLDGPPGLCRAFSLLEQGSTRAEIFSYVRMLVAGGFWFDSDTPAAGLRDACGAMCDGDPMISFRFEPENRPRHSLLASPRPGHPIVFRTLERIINNTLWVKSKAGKSYISADGSRRSMAKTLYVSGPHNLHEAMCDVLRKVDQQQLCGDRVLGAPYRWEGNNTHFGGRAHTPVGRVYGSGNARFRYVSCPSLGHHISEYSSVLKVMGERSHTKIAVARL